MAAERPRLGIQPLGLYVHLPWCVRKCPYCDFNSHELRTVMPGPDYVESLLKDLEQDMRLVRGRKVSHVYFGGGTPSLFKGDLIERLLAGIGRLADLEPEAEISLEANPGTIERDSFAAYAQAGVNRVSLGVQSFDSSALERIGRIHGPTEISLSLESLVSSGIDNFNIDLMYGLPGQTIGQALLDVEAAIDAGAPHISHYQLTL